MAVGGGELGLSQGALEEVFDILAAGAALEKAHRNFSWFLSAHDLK